MNYDINENFIGIFHKSMNEYIMMVVWEIHYDGGCNFVLRVMVFKGLYINQPLCLMKYQLTGDMHQSYCYNHIMLVVQCCQWVIT